MVSLQVNIDKIVLADIGPIGSSRVRGQIYKGINIIEQQLYGGLSTPTMRGDKLVRVFFPAERIS